ncbi:uncharacterized protein [Ranitomeya imitator]|uniref:uncharacterized protein n=1 Tax=Ranitomeya imitator TaxID=111125 RepID=UPI0037E7CDA2
MKAGSMQRLEQRFLPKKKLKNGCRDFSSHHIVIYEYPRLSKKTQIKLVFRKEFRCHNNTRSNFQSSTTKQCHKKHTNCGATLSITVRNMAMKRTKDKLLSTHPCVISINHEHNHAIFAADALRFRRPSPEVEEAFRILFAKGHSPSSALQSYTFDLQEQFGEQAFLVLSDRSKCPDIQWCYHRYYSIFQRKYGPPDGLGMISSLKIFIDTYNKSCGSVCAKMELEEDKDLIIAICSPLMQRVHKYLPTSGEIAFMDSSRSMDRHNSRIFLLLAPSVAGALPLAILVMYSEAQVVITRALKLLQSILPEDAFYGRGIEHGPGIIITDDSHSERNSLKDRFSDSRLLLCKFHVLQAFWRYIWDSNNHVQKVDRQDIYTLFKKLVNEQSQQQFESLFTEVMSSPMLKKYLNVQKYLEKMRDRAGEWAMCHRATLLTRGPDTNNYSEANIRVLKEKVLMRVKAFNIVQLFDFLTTRFMTYFEQRIISVLSNRTVNVSRSRYFIPEIQTDNLIVTHISDDTCSVKNSTSGHEYAVNMLTNTCFCPVGSNGAYCKHQFAAATKFNISTSQFIPVTDAHAKLALHKILADSIDVPEGWYDNLHGSRGVPEGWHDKLQGSTSTVALSQEDDHTVMVDELCLNEEDSCAEKTVPMTVTDQNNERGRHLKVMFQVLEEKLSEREDIFGPGVDALYKNFLSVEKRDASLFSALHTFGKSNGPLALRTSRRIPVQPTAVARRNTYLGGRHVQQSGRPAKRTLVAEHGYCISKKSVPDWVMPVGKLQHAASQSLSLCGEWQNDWQKASEELG